MSIVLPNIAPDPASAPVIGVSDPGFTPGPNGYPIAQSQPLVKQGWISEPGNLDLSARQMIPFAPPGTKPDDVPYSYGSEYSARRNLPDGRSVTFPTIYDGKAHTVDEAFANYQKTGKHLGIYKQGAPEKMINDYENFLHSRPIRVNGKLLNGDVWKSMNDPARR
jgi:hypothetical protein